jgi:hypothetical protein
VDENIFYYVPKHKFLGGYFMPYVALNYANGELVANITGTNLNTGAGGSGFADMYVQPINLGWHLKRADFNLGYAFVAPTGRFTQGASNNVGSGYWGNDITSGTTVYLTKNKGTTANLATAWEIHGQKRGTNITPGQTFTAEWGFGQVLPLKKDMSGLLQVGLVAYDQWQTSKSTGTLTIAGIPIPERGIPYYSVHAIGVQPTLFCPRRISQPSSNTTMSTMLWLVRKDAPSYLAFRGRCGFPSRSCPRIEWYPSSGVMLVVSRRKGNKESASAVLDRSRET